MSEGEVKTLKILTLHAALYLGIWASCEWYGLADTSAQLMGMIWK